MNKRPANSERRLDRTISVLFEIANAVSQTRNLTELYRVIHRTLASILPAENFFIALYDESRDVIGFPYFTDPLHTPSDEAPLEDFPFIRRVIQARSPVISSERDSGGMGSGTWLGTPLIIKDEVIGVMGIMDNTPESAYSREDISLLNSVSQHAALAIERKEAETQIQDHRQIMEKILESSPVGIALIQDRVFKWVNSEMVRMFGYCSKGELEGQSVMMVYQAEEDFKFAGRTIYQGLYSRGKVDYEMNLRQADNTLFPVHVRLNSTGGDDPMSWTIGTFTDISQRRAAEKETADRDRLQGVLEMAGAVCHEINQPLQAIIGYSELLDLEPDQAQVANSIRAIKSQAARLGKITTNLANITQYKTVAYPGQNKIVDIWEASPQGRKFSR